MSKRLRKTEPKSLVVDGDILPPEILEVILDKLFFTDHIRFRAVCKSWNIAAVNNQKHKHQQITAVQPMLLFINEVDFNYYYGIFKLSSLINLLSIDEERLYKSVFRYDDWTDDYEVMCLGSSYGWLALQIKKSSILLLNPFTKKMIGIPSIPAEFGKVYKVIMSCDPFKNSGEMVIAALTSKGKIALIRPGQQGWTLVNEDGEDDDENQKGDLIFHKGLLYVLKNKHLVEVDYNQHPQLYDRHVPDLGRIPFNMRKMNGVFKCSRNFLVEASNGDLLIVECSLTEKQDSIVVHDENGNQVQIPWKFEVFKVKEIEYGHWSVTKMRNISDAIFVSDNSCLCNPAGAMSGTNPNSLYFFMSFYDKRYPQHWGHLDRQVGVYDLKNETIRELGGYRRVNIRNELPPMPIALLAATR